MNLSNEDKQENYLNKKRKKDSNDKKVYLYENYENNEILKEEKTFGNLEELSSYLSSLKNPYTIIDGKAVNLDTVKNQHYFFYSKDVNIVYEKEDNTYIYEDYKYYFSEYEETKEERIKIKYPMLLNKLIVAPKFFFDLPIINCPKFYKGIDDYQMGLLLFFVTRKSNIFNLFIRKKSGSTLYIMKQMSRWNEYFIYFDLRKLKNILQINQVDKPEFIKQIKRFIFYSLFNIRAVNYDIKEGFNIIEEYYYYIWKEIYNSLSMNNTNNFIKILFDSYIKLYKDYIHALVLKEEKEYNQKMIFILDHYKDEIDYEYITQTSKKNDATLKFLIKHSLNNKKENEKLFRYLDDDNYKIETTLISKGIEVIKNKIMIGYYEGMYDFDIANFDDVKILKLYKDEILANFGLNNPSYIYKFIDFLKDKNQSEKDHIIFSKFLKIMATEIELDIRNYYNNNLTDEYFFISKYYDAFIEKKGVRDKKKIDFIKNNIPLDYFIIKYAKKSKDILDIIPSCNLVKNIILKKSKNFSSVIYQSDYYNKTDNQEEKEKILQRAVEERIKNEPSLLLNYTEKTLIFEIECIIPSAKIMQSERNNPVEKYYKAKTGTTINLNQDIFFYMSQQEKEDMNNLSKAISQEKDSYQNIILIQKVSNAKNYNMGIIKFINEKSFILILSQITLSQAKNNFEGVNKTLEQDILYITNKIENFLAGYKSAGVYLFYILDLDDNDQLSNELVKTDKQDKKDSKFTEQKSSTSQSKKTINIDKIDFKKGLNKELREKVYLLFFGRKYLNFYTQDGKKIKELAFKNKEIQLLTSDIQHYFLEENIQNMFEKVISIFNIKIGKLYLDNYDYNDIIGNFLILTKLNNTHVTIVINIEDKKLNFLEIKNNVIEQVMIETHYDEKISYFFEIINKKDINPNSMFSKISI